MASNAYYASQDRMNEIIEAIFKEVFKKIADCARFYEINRNTLSRRLHEKSSRSIQVAFKKHFIDTEEYSLIIYIWCYDEKDLSIRSKLLAKTVNFLIHAKKFSTKSIENFLFKRFLKRHSEVKKHCMRFISAKRKDVYEFKKLKIYFKKLNEVLNEHEIIVLNT